MIDFNYTAPELLPFRIQEVLDAPNEPHRIGGVVYVPEGGGECEVISKGIDEVMNEWCIELSCGHAVWGSPHPPNYCCDCGRKIMKAVER